MPLGIIDPSQITGINGPIDVPMPNLDIRAPTWRDRLRGKLGSSLFPMIGADQQGLTQPQIDQARLAGIRQFGLGMLGNIGSGQSFGQGLGQAAQFAQGNIQKLQQQAFEAARIKQQQERQASLDARAIEQQDIENSRAERAESRQSNRDVISDQHFDATLGAQSADRATQREIQRAQIQAQKDISAANRANALAVAGVKGGAGQKPTEYDKKASLLFGEMTDAEKQLQTAGVPSKGSMVWNSALGSMPATRVFTGENYRKYEAAGTRWAQNFLYLKSGAQAPEQEVRRTMQQYLPQPGDGPDVIAQKATARQQAMANVGGILNPNVGGGASPDMSGWSIEPVQ